MKGDVESTREDSNRESNESERVFDIRASKQSRLKRSRHTDKTEYSLQEGLKEQTHTIHTHERERVKIRTAGRTNIRADVELPSSWFEQHINAA